MKTTPLGNYLRTYRRKAGLSQRELGILLAYADEGAVSRHERSRTLPPLLIAIGYEVIFKRPISELFPGMRETVKLTVEKRLARFENDLQEKTRSGGEAYGVAQKLAWLSERRDTNDS